MVAVKQRRQLDQSLIDLARATPILDVCDRLGAKLTRQGAEHVGPCPICGGEDRFQANPARNLYHCRKCGHGGEGGDTLKLIQKALDVDFRAAIEWITGEDATSHVIDPAELDRRKQEARAKAAARERQEAERAERRRKDAYAIWKAAEPAAGSLVENYLRLRGIADSVIDQVVAGKALRFARRLPYPDGQGGTLFEGPAMVAVMRRPDAQGSFGGVHRTWLDLTQPKGRPRHLDPEGDPLPMKLALGRSRRCAIRLIGGDHAALPATMIAGEGIETTLSAAGRAGEAFGPFAAWCLINRGNMAGRALAREQQDQPDMMDEKAWTCPPRIGRLVYLGDDGPEHTVTRDALTRGLRRQQRLHAVWTQAGPSVPPLDTQIAWAGAGKDFNDLLSPRRSGPADQPLGGRDGVRCDPASEDEDDASQGDLA